MLRVFFKPLFSIATLVHIKTTELLIASLYSSLNKICDIMPELLIGYAVDIVISRQNETIISKLGFDFSVIGQLVLVAAITGFFWLFESLFELLSIVSWSKISLKTEDFLRRHLYEKIQEANTAFIDQKRSGDLLSMIQEDSFHISQFFEKGINEVIQLIVNVFVIGVIFFVISPQIALVSLIPVPIILFCSLVFKQKVSPLYEKVRIKIGFFTHQLTRRLAGLITIKSYTTEQYEAKKVGKFSQEVFSASFDASYMNALYTPLLRIIVVAGFLSTLILGGIQTHHDSIAISSYATLIFLSQRFLWSFAVVLTIVDAYEKTSVSIRRILQFLSRAKTMPDGDLIASTALDQSAICFNNVSFSYQKGDEKKVLSDISFCIPPKSMVAFVGKTGSGKSTIMKLLLRLYDVTEGNITLGEEDIRAYTLSSLRSSISFVSQEAYMIDGTIKDNIKYGTFSATDPQVREAASKAIIDDFVLTFEKQYDTVLTESGKNLSGGQKQRISIARAVLKNAPIILFDEVTSSLDNQTESDFQKSIQALRKEHTIILIAHRLSTVIHADTIYVLDKGRIVQQGNHDELLAQKGLYADLWGLQKL